MEQINSAYGLPKETVSGIYENTKARVHSLDADIDFFNIVNGVLQGDTLRPYWFIHSLHYVLRMSINLIKKKWFLIFLKKQEDDILQNLRQMQTRQMTLILFKILF